MHITLLTGESGALGAGVYARQLVANLVSSAHPGSVITVGSLRNGSPDVRLPAKLVEKMGSNSTHLLGHVMWRNTEAAHRLLLSIPPAKNELLSVLDLVPLHFPDDGPWPRLLRSQARAAVGITTLSHLIADEIRAELGVKRVWVVPPYVDERFFSTCSEIVRGDPPFLLHVGGASRRKGIALLAEAWRRLILEAPDAELIMVGPNHSSRSTLLKQPGVSYLGQLDDDSIFRLMRQAAGVVVPSQYEGFGMPVAEAMAAGTPVVVIRGTACEEVAGGAGVVADADPDSLGAALLRCLAGGDLLLEKVAAGQNRAEGFRQSSSCQAQLIAYSEAFSE